MTTALKEILAYHRVSKHNFNDYAPGPNRLELDIQPDPFRHYKGTRLLEMERERDEIITRESYPAYAQVFKAGEIPPADLNMKSISRLFFDSLALSAWKKTEYLKWPLRINPSSGNLHPTESYLLCGAVEGLLECPAVCHYSPLRHALEVRAELSPELWNKLCAGFPKGTLFVGLTSIHWRTAWKYGVRAFRYSHLDVGHALGALGFAAAGLGWQAQLLPNLGSEELTFLLGTADQKGPEKEIPACLLALFPTGEVCQKGRVSQDALSDFRKLDWQGMPARLSAGHVEWLDIEKAVSASQKEETDYAGEIEGGLEKGMGGGVKGEVKGGVGEGVKGGVGEEVKGGENVLHSSKTPEFGKAEKKAPALREVIHKRRSALEMNNSAYMEQETFYKILKTLKSAFPAKTLLPLKPFVHLLLFVNRVKGLDSGLYVFLREYESESEKKMENENEGMNESKGEKEKKRKKEKENKREDKSKELPLRPLLIKKRLKNAMREDFQWEKPKDCPPDLELYRLLERDLHYFAARLSCGQRKAEDACFTIGMLSEFEKPLKDIGPWIYPYLYWECGILGQLLYLEAEARGFRGCGIGCFFDEPVHEMLGFEGVGFQDLYHFAVGFPLPEKGVKLLPAYEDSD